MAVALVAARTAARSPLSWGPAAGPAGLGRGPVRGRILGPELSHFIDFRKYANNYSMPCINLLWLLNVYVALVTLLGIRPVATGISTGLIVARNVIDTTYSIMPFLYN